MDHYVDIRLKSNTKMSENRLMNGVVTNLHNTLVRLETSAIGISFPKYRIKLGDTLRIHGQADLLNYLQEQNWLGGLVTHCDVSETFKVPVENIQYRTISRKQPTMTKSKLNRLIKRGTIELEQEKAYKAKMFAQGLSEPYLELVSSSNGKKHRRYISFGQLAKIPVIGQFDTFGLSTHATIPWF